MRRLWRAQSQVAKLCSDQWLPAFRALAPEQSKEFDMTQEERDNFVFAQRVQAIFKVDSKYVEILQALFQEFPAAKREIILGILHNKEIDVDDKPVLVTLGAQFGGAAAFRAGVRPLSLHLSDKR